MTQSEIVQRRTRISEYIQVHGKLSTAHACRMFGVSDETIRKDFLYLEEMHVLEKTYGGARLRKSDETKSYAARQDEHYLAKAGIAQRAAQLIPAGGCTIGLDMGTTFGLLAGYLAQRSGSLIVTNSNAAIQQLAGSENRLYVLGGEYDAASHSFHGENACRALRELSLDIVFIGTGGVRGRDGISTARFADVELKREFIRRSQRKVVLTDSSKFYSASLVEVAGWNEVDTLITDTGIPAEDAARLGEKLELILV